jgi:predicted ATPase/DNA-binding SARP family transcriptional activator
MHTRSRTKLLGGLCIEQADRIITRFRTQKTGALLAYLAYYRERSHPREQLIELIWPEADLDSGRNSLSRALSSLRQQLEPPGVPHGAILRADRLSVQLNPEAVTTDVGEFDAALHKAATAGSGRERMLFLADAAERYGGELLPGHYEDWCLVERERLAETYLRTLHQLVELLERTGDLDHALGYARRAVSADPLREEAYQEIMRLLAAAGQPTLALRYYRELEQRLEEQLGEAPSAATLQLAREIERQSTGYTVTERQTAGPRADASPPPSALPSRLPTGTVTFLLTDIAGSTAQWERQGEAFTAPLASHHTLLRRTFRRFGGYEVKEAGDGFIVAFECARDALACAVASQQALEDHPWSEGAPREAWSGPLRVRMVLHSGDVALQEGDYHGLVLHHASRMLAAGHGGQILCSEATAAVVQRNLEPGIQLTDLGVYRLRDVEMPERLFQVEYPEMAQRVFPPPRAEARSARNLPLQFTRFVGRERELEQLEELLLAEQTRLVTLTGSGGTGKSRLALELASHLSERFSGAVWFVPLADLVDARLVVDAVQKALCPGTGPRRWDGGKPSPSQDAPPPSRSPAVEPLEQVVEMLSQQPSLLVLDNFEHLVEEGAALVQTLLERAPLLKCLVTSRQRLDLSGEREFVVPPLQTPAGGDAPAQLGLCESVRLFIDRAQAVKSDFQVTNKNAPAVAELCQRLEGIPLAIELAAARAQVLTPAQMLNQLARRFDFLVSRRRDGAKRHQTLHAAVDWSYRLLTPELQRFFARLSVFRGGWTVEAAEAVCEEGAPADGADLAEATRAGPALDYLAQLRECSLVLAEEDGVEVRFRMLETLREYAAEQLEASEEIAALRREHADFFLALAAQADSSQTPADRVIWMERLETENANLGAALDWMQREEPDAERRLRLGWALYPFWLERGYLREGRERLQLLLGLPGASVPARARAKALLAAANLAAEQGDYAAKRSLSEEGLAVQRELDDKWRIAGWLSDLGNMDLVQGDYAAARSRYEESLAIHRELENKYGIADLLCRLGGVARSQGDSVKARLLLEESLSVLRELASKPEIAELLPSLGFEAWEQGDHAAARALLEESLAIQRELGEKRGIAWSLNGLGRMTLMQGDSAAARSLFAESLAIYWELRNKVQIIQSLEGLAAAEGRPERAARLFGAAESLREAVGAPTRGYLGIFRYKVSEHSIASARATLGEEAFAAAWAEGRAMTLEQAIPLALAGTAPN